MSKFQSTEHAPISLLAALRGLLRRLRPGGCRLHLCVELTQAGAAGLDQAAVLGFGHDRGRLEHQYRVHCQGVHRSDCQLLPAGEFPWEYRMPARVAKSLGARLKVPAAGQEHLFDRHGYAPGVYDFDVQGEIAASKWLHANADLQANPAALVAGDGVEHAQGRAQGSKQQRQNIRPSHDDYPPSLRERTPAAGSADSEAVVPAFQMHGRVVMRSPLGEPSPAAQRFLDGPDRYDNYVEPSDRIAKAGSLAAARREARQYQPGEDQTPGKALSRRAGDIAPNDYRLRAAELDEMASRIRALRCMDQADAIEAAACDLREKAKAIELLALNISEGLERAA